MVPSPAPPTGTVTSSTSTSAGTAAGPLAPARALGLPRVRALDGLRGLAVAGVLAYHLDVPWLPGGFLGVSLFFTLSGFLITSLLLVERSQGDHISLRGFWARRFRRLLPVAWAGLVLAIVFAAVAGDADQLRRLPGDVTAALAEVANWHFIVVGDSYTAGYQAPSPVLHYWSLAIEEQFYLVFPLLIAGLVVRRARLATWWLVIAGLLAASMIATLVLYDPTNTARVYFGSGTRIAEILIGVLLALATHGWWQREPDRRFPHRGPLRNRAVRVLLPPAAALATLTLWWHVSLADDWIYRGGLWLVAVLSCGLVMGAVTPGPMQRLLGSRALVALGIVSYGVYVYHWPIFLWITNDRTGLSGVPLAAARLAVTGVLAVASFFWLEKPIRQQRVHWSTVMGAGLALLAVAIIVSSIVVGGRADARAVSAVAAATAGGASIVTQPPVSSPLGAPADPGAAGGTLPPVTPPRRVLFLGDSLLHQAYPVIASEFTADGIDTRAIGGPGQSLLGHQAAWLGDLERTLSEYDPDVVVIESCCGYGNTNDPYLIDGHPAAPDSPELWGAWQDAADRAVAMAQRDGRLVLWVLAPPAKTNGYYGPIEGRIGHANQIALDLATRHPGMGFVDWRIISGPGGSYVDALPDSSGKVVTVRAGDGLHFTPAGMGVLADLTRTSVEQSWQAVRGRQTPTGTTPGSVVPGS